ncbi:MAG: hypothetical protein RLN92_02740, partial [Alloalcanivorax xenomutans]
MPDSTSGQHRPDQDGLPMEQRRWAMFAIVVSVGLAVLDSNIVNVALPTIAGDLEISPSQSVWIVNAYLLAVATTLLP